MGLERADTMNPDTVLHFVVGMAYIARAIYGMLN